MDNSDGSGSMKMDVAKHIVTTIFRKAMHVMPIANLLSKRQSMYIKLKSVGELNSI